MSILPFFLKVFLILWIPIAPFGYYFGSMFSLCWTAVSVLLSWLITRNTVGVLQDFIRYVDSGNAFEQPGQMTVRKSFLYGPLIRRFKKIQRKLGAEIAKTRQEQELLNTVLNTISDGVIVVDRQRNVLFVNPSARKLCGITKENIYGKSIEEIVPISTLHELSRGPAFFSQPVFKKFSVFYEHQEKQLSMQTQPFGREEKSGCVITVHDLSEVYRQELSRNEFTANASHELRTPLMAIQGYLSSLLDGGLTAELGEKFLKKISQNVDRLNELSQKMLDASRFEQNSEGDANLDILDMSIVFQSVIENYKSLTSLKGLDFSVEGFEGSFLVRGKDASLRTILENLLDNAIKYTMPGGKIIVSLERKNGEIVLKVSDTGVGIPKEAQAKIFDRFFRVDPSRTSQGAGLGLSIVKKMVEEMGGKACVDSAPGIGSTFTISLPTSKR